MLTAETILPLLKDTENERVERTISTDAREKFCQAICAFANDVMDTGNPGYIFIGADNDGNPSGLNYTDDLQKELAGIRSEGNILPQPAMQVYKVSVDGGDIAVIEVQPSKFPPVRYRGRVWIRIGARKAIANDEEIRILSERRMYNTPNFESEPCVEATVEDLDISVFRTIILPAMVDAEDLAEDKRPIEIQLASLGFYNIPYGCPTYAGIILIGKNPTLFVPGAYIQYVHFEGEGRGSKVLNERIFKKNLITELANLEDFAEFTLERKRPELISALRDKDFIGYPHKATRELLMNICQHRAYNGSNAPAHIYEKDTVADTIPFSMPDRTRPDDGADKVLHQHENAWRERCRDNLLRHHRQGMA
ncbi:MAG: putative DNA binding domain-containing protein, partial [Bacteroidales bacterium]|nr:putative DNA binding domain-containing protein [Bacteroidales bacterium]